jgi:hypothetical protein
MIALNGDHPLAVALGSHIRFGEWNPPKAAPALDPCIWSKIFYHFEPPPSVLGLVPRLRQVIRLKFLRISSEINKQSRPGTRNSRKLSSAVFGQPR